ncbi:MULTISPECIES: DCC1-like thiol-disulfide oxidoreductase family protein [unclassified Coleofasciculus]|uniref:DCC1-like thiol-disulfide oxidoreductase family protein n=1 Tax=unclassified Coleofasciculus TaxID=2692782 RepID=UPI0018823139|nr:MULTISPECIES: DCC1-like thiol-disulfide oxidoreductase family protein [unclassified Coleofasciculus]MBE9125805.1 DUF393 domain-containing protein [Coleofasciculus sp. LEGE 07081]MBE9149010.1 DUF393 domain-containing protein [Coleofasciculus sp. LEGE 07092]
MNASKQKPKTKLATKLKELFGFDLRSLAAFRIGIALILIADLIIRSSDINTLYSDTGVLPRTALNDIIKPWYWSVYSLSGQPLVQTLVFLLAGLIAVALLVGYRTRLAAIASWAMLISLHNRNPAVLFAGDDMLRALMFWAMFLPLGACYSIDSALNTSTKPLPKRILSGATFALTLQICYVYIFSAAFKTTSPTWWPDGSAVYYALSFDQYAVPLGQFLLNFPPLLTAFTFATLVLEWLGPLFLFVPFRTTFFRCATIVTFILLHLGFGLTLHIGLFAALGMFTWLVFIPTEVWDGLAKRVRTPQRAGLAIYYDADCGFCKKVVYLIRTFLILPKTPLLMAQEQEDASIYADMQEKNSWVVVDWQGNRRFKWEAIAYVVSLSPMFGFLASVLRWKPFMSVGTKFYETIASNRRAAGTFTKPLKFRPLEVHSSGLLNAVTLLLLVYTTVWNVRILSERALSKESFAYKTLHRRTFNSIDWISRLTRLDQSWSIFAPGPPRDDGWYVMSGRLEDGTEVNLLDEGKPVNWNKPTIRRRNVTYRNMQWRTYFINLNRGLGQKLIPSYGQYLCRDWNARHPESKQLKSLEIYFMSERTVPPGETQDVEKTNPWQQPCSQDSLENE